MEQLATIYSHGFRADWCRLVSLCQMLLLENHVPAAYRAILIQTIEEGRDSEEKLRNAITELSAGPP